MEPPKYSILGYKWKTSNTKFRKKILSRLEGQLTEILVRNVGYSLGDELDDILTVKEYLTKITNHETQFVKTMKKKVSRNSTVWIKNLFSVLGDSSKLFEKAGKSEDIKKMIEKYVDEGLHRIKEENKRRKYNDPELIKKRE